MPLAGRALVLHRPRDTDAMLVEEAFDHEELLPYWAELWPSGVALARQVHGRAWRGARVLELGCGLGLVATAAALAGARVLATDWSAASIAATQANAERNGATVEAAVVDWNHPELLLARAPWDVVVGADILYEARNIPLLLDLLPRLTREAWIADPGRPAAERFLMDAEREWDVVNRDSVFRLTARDRGLTRSDP